MLVSVSVTPLKQPNRLFGVWASPGGAQSNVPEPGGLKCLRAGRAVMGAVEHACCAWDESGPRLPGVVGGSSLSCTSPQA